MKQYIDLLSKILKEPEAHQMTRSGPTIARFGEKLEFDLREGFPLMTTKFVSMKHIARETKWYMMGTDKIDYLKEHNMKIWDLWADENNSIGPTYGYQWRHWVADEDWQVEDKPVYDQVQDCIDRIKNNPTDRRIIVNGWNVAHLDKMALPPCLVMYQFHVGDNDTLNMTVYQRFADSCLGVPYDIAEMGLILFLVAKITGKTPAKLTFFYGNVHIYENHIDTLKEQLLETPKQLPTITYEGELNNIEDYDPEKVILTNYPKDEIKRYKYDISK